MTDQRTNLMLNHVVRIYSALYWVDAVASVGKKMTLIKYSHDRDDGQP